MHRPNSKETYVQITSQSAQHDDAQPASTNKERFWPEGWWKLMETRIGIIPLPVYLLLLGLITGFAVTGKVPGEISMAIAVLAFFGFTCAEIGKRMPLVRNIGAAAIFATFIPSALT
jgi:Na+/citrate or Na+/malate symporter